MRRVPPRDRFITEHALLRVHASIFNIDHRASNLRERGEHTLSTVANHREIIQRGVSGLRGNENVYIMTRDEVESLQSETKLQFFLIPSRIIN